jgi:hypothetical protein
VLLAAAVDQGFESDASPDVEGGDTFRGVHLVPDQGQQIDPERGDVDRNLADGLGGVGVEQNPVLVGDAGEFGDGLQGAGLVVGQHDRYQHGAVGDRGGERRRLDPALDVDGQLGDFDAVQPV